MLFMLSSISIFAGNVSDNNESTAKDIILDKGDSLDHSSERPRSLNSYYMRICQWYGTVDYLVWNR